jgi:hypothetical protein
LSRFSNSSQLLIIGARGTRKSLSLSLDSEPTLRAFHSIVTERECDERFCKKEHRDGGAVIERVVLVTVIASLTLAALAVVVYALLRMAF